MKGTRRPPEPFNSTPAFMKIAARTALPMVTLSYWSSMATPQQPSKLQQLYDTAKQVIGGGREPSPEEIIELKEVLSSVPLEELGLDTARMQERQARGLFKRVLLPAPPPHRGSTDDGQSRAIKYLHIHEEADVSVGIFCLPANATIPLHNHPGMSVFSRLLYGTMRLRAYDWEDPEDPALPGRIRAAKLVTSQQLTAPTEPMALFPRNGGNVHTFQAVTECAVLDVLAPPYSPSTGRDCTYYREHLQSEMVGGDGELLGPAEEFPPVDLEVCTPPNDFLVLPGVYRGLKVSPRSMT